MSIKSVKLGLFGVLCALVLSATPAHAHGAGEHQAPEYNATNIVDLGSRYVASLVEQKKKIEGVVLNSSWNSLPESDKGIQKEGSWYFIVKVAHKKEKKTLYLLISRDGTLYNANFKGVFEHLDE